MSKKYKEFSQLNLPSIEQEILAKWDAEQAFEKSVELRSGAAPFVFYEGPPSANGMPGIHHVISRTLKDLVCRYKTMKGFKVSRKGGWDTHGLPIELGVEKELGITKEDIGVKITVEEYNKKCREAVLRFKDKWDDITKKMGYWVDLNDPYITFKNEYIETLWWLLKQLYNKGLLYESVSIQPYSPAAGTGLSSHELNQPGTYKDVKDTSATVMFRAVQNEKSKFLHDAVHGAEVFFMAWTTTPWTLPSNLGLTVGGSIEYALVQTFNPYTHLPVNIVLAKDLIHKYLKDEGENGDFKEYNGEQKIVPWQTITTFNGSQLEGLHYEQLLPYEANSMEVIKSITSDADPFRVLVDTFVTTEDGTGIVHTAPAFGADDFKVGKKYGIGILTMVDREGKFVDGLGEFSNRYVKNYKDEKDYVDVNVDICVKLKKENRAFKVEKYEHSYPHCWRTDKPVLYYPLDAWFIKTTALKDKMVELNKTINWKPKSTGEGRFGNWLENMVDWNLSRSRFWGTPLPIWKSKWRDGKLFKESGLVKSNTICISTKNDFLEYECYFFDTKQFNLDLQKKESKLIDRITSINAEVEDSFNKKSNPADSNELRSLQLMGIKKLFAIDLDQIYQNPKEILLTPYELDRLNFPFEILEPYCIKVDKEILNKLDLHKPHIDNIIIRNNDTSYLTRVPDLIDVWFDSGAMPYAQWGLDYEKVKRGDKYPFKLPAGVNSFEELYPASFIAEGVDQTRGWFYTLHAISSLVYESVAYKTVVSNGLVLDKNGNKMSKRLGNVVDPFHTISTYGADATRWYLITNASPWDNMKFDIEGIKEVQRKFFGTLYNTYQFFALYANVDGFAFKEASVPLNERPEIDRWILSSLNTLIKKVNEAMDDYEPTQAGRLIEEFVDEHLSNWYVRLCRRRFWKGEYETDKISAYQTLYECLETVVRLIAPISPFFSDMVFQNLNAVTNRFNASSIHHVDFPVADESKMDSELEERMQLAQDTSSLVLSLRKKQNIKVRQPLQKVLIPVLNPHMKEQLYLIEDLIKTEVNVKEVEYLTADNSFIKKKIKPNFQTLGKKLGSKMKAVAAALGAFTQEQIAELEKETVYNLLIDNEPVLLYLTDVEISSEDVPGWLVASKGSLTVALDVTVTPELLNEGNARELVNRIQKIRKDNGFELTDRIDVQLAGAEILKPSISEYKSYICAEILADSLDFEPEITNGVEVEVNDQFIKVKVSKKGG
jgi:isoleucyl-tRNA synthetase